MRRRSITKTALLSAVVWVAAMMATDVPLYAQSKGQVVPVSVGVGGARLVRFRSSVDRVSVSSAKIADAKVVGSRSVQVSGLAIGETTVLVWDTRGSITRLVVGVGVPTEALQTRLQALFPDEKISVEASGGAVVLKGTVSDPIISERAAKLAAAYVGRDGGKKKNETKVLNFLEVSGRQQVQLRAKVAEVSRRALRQMGVNLWARPQGHVGGLLAPEVPLAGAAPGFQSGGELSGLQALPDDSGRTPLPTLISPLQGLNQAFGLFFASQGSASPISVAVSLMQGRGLAKVLSEPTLVAYSGQSAEFIAGGEFPLPLIGNDGELDVEYKKFGVQLGFTPTVLANRTIHLRVAVTVSERDDLRNVQGFPSLTMRSAETTVRLRNGQSFAIAGLLQDQINSTIEKVPLLGDIPILGALFRRKIFDRQERELVILVTAQLVRPLKPGEVPPLPGEDEVSDPGAVAFFLLGSIDPELKAERRSQPAGPVGYSK